MKLATVLATGRFLFLLSSEGSLRGICKKTRGLYYGRKKDFFFYCFSVVDFLNIDKERVKDLDCCMGADFLHSMRRDSKNLPWNFEQVLILLVGPKH